MDRPIIAIPSRAAIGRAFNALAASVAIAILVGPPASAQNYSDTYNFLQAIKERNVHYVQAMLAQPGSDVLNSRERGSGDAALHIVTRSADHTWLSFLLARGAWPDLQNQEGNTALAIAAQIGCADCVVVLIRHRASVDIPNAGGETPLIIAVHRRDTAMVQFLIAAGANPRTPDSVAGLSALEYARRDPHSTALLQVLERSGQR